MPSLCPASRRILVLIAGFALAPALAATQYTITILNDNLTTNGDCSLREAIRAATNDVAVDGCPAGSGDDVITLPLGTVTFDADDEHLTSASGHLTLQGPTGDSSQAIVSCAFGAGFLDLSSSDVTLRDLTVMLCDKADGVAWGGAIHALGSSLELDNVVFFLNSGGARGGAVYFGSGSGSESLEIRDCQFGSNTVDGGEYDDQPEGGAVHAVAGNGDRVEVSRTLFSANGALSTTQVSRGGGLHVEASGSAVVELRALDLVDNRCGSKASVNHRGCGLYLWLAGSAAATLADLDVEGNYAGATDSSLRVAGIELFLSDSSTLLAERLWLDGNFGPSSTSSTESQVLVEVRNTASAVVRDVLAVNGQTGVRGVASSTGSPVLRLDHVTAVDNEVGVSLFAGDLAALDFQNSIVWGNTTSDVVSSGNETLTSNHVGGGSPLFVDAAAGDYRLQSASSARDSGNAALSGVGFADLDHAPRVVGSETDKGAFEYGGIFADDFESGDTSAWSSAV